MREPYCFHWNLADSTHVDAREESVLARQHQAGGHGGNHGMLPREKNDPPRDRLVISQEPEYQRAEGIAAAANSRAIRRRDHGARESGIRTGHAGVKTD